MGLSLNPWLSSLDIRTSWVWMQLRHNGFCQTGPTEDDGYLISLVHNKREPQESRKMQQKITP